MAGIDVVKSLGPIWSEQPLPRPERKDQRQHRSPGDEKPPTDEKAEQTPSIDEFI